MNEALASLGTPELLLHVLKPHRGRADSAESHGQSIQPAARIRRAEGFRCVVGAYHPSCFIIVFTLDETTYARELAPLLSDRVLPAEHLLSVGFKTIRPHHRYPRLRLELSEL